MTVGKLLPRTAGMFAAGLVLSLSTPRPLAAHCDTMDGPVVVAAKAALQKADVAPALKWVKPEREAEIREVFTKTMEVRKTSPAARDLADHYFFETLVRVHREGEGAPYTGLKPAGTEVNPGIAAADRALEKGTVEDVIQTTTAAVSTGIRQRFTRAMELKKHAEESVTAGRQYVEAYVEFIHFVERLQEDAMSAVGHEGGSHATETVSRRSH